MIRSIIKTTPQALPQYGGVRDVRHHRCQPGPRGRGSQGLVLSGGQRVSARSQSRVRVRQLRRPGDQRQLQRHLPLQHRLSVDRHHGTQAGPLHFQGIILLLIPDTLIAATILRCSCVTLRPG